VAPAIPRIEGLPEAVRKALLAALGEARQSGVPFEITSTLRRPEEQAALYARRAANKYPVAPPGRSLHETGMAVDVTTAPMTRGVLTQILAKYGFQWAGPKDQVHYRYVGAASDPFRLAVQQKYAADPFRQAVEQKYAADPFRQAVEQKYAAPRDLRALAEQILPTLRATRQKEGKLESAALTALSRPGNVWRAAETALARARPDAATLASLLLSPGGMGGALASMYRPSPAGTPAPPGSVEAANRLGAQMLRAAASEAGAPLTAPIRPPDLITSLLGQKAGMPGYVPARVADYIRDFLLNPGDILVGKGLAKGAGLGLRTARALAASRPAAGAAAALGARSAQIFSKAMETRTGAAVVAGLSKMGMAPGERIRRAIERPYQRAIAARGQEWGEIVSNMADRQEALRLRPGTFSPPPSLVSDRPLVMEAYEGAGGVAATRALEAAGGAAATRALGRAQTTVSGLSRTGETGAQAFLKGKRGARKLAAREERRIKQREDVLGRVRGTPELSARDQARLDWIGDELSIYERRPKLSAAEQASVTSLRAERAALVTKGQVKPETALRLFAPTTRKLTADETLLLQAYRATGRGAGPLQSAVIEYVQEVVRHHPTEVRTYEQITGEVGQSLAEARTALVAHQARLSKVQEAVAKVRGLEQTRRETLDRLYNKLGALAATPVSGRRYPLYHRLPAVPARTITARASAAIDRVTEQIALAKQKFDAARAAVPITTAQARKLEKALAPLEQQVRGLEAQHAVYGKLTGPAYGQIEGLLAHSIANRYGVPRNDIVAFGRRVLDHFEETLAQKRSAGGKPFLYAEDPQKFRENAIRDYMAQGFTRERASSLGDAASMAYAGGGIKQVREAALDQLERRIVEMGVAKPVVNGVLLPGHVQVPHSMVFGDQLQFKQVPIAVYNFIRREATLSGRPLLSQGLKSPRYLTKDVEGAGEVSAKALEAVQSLVGTAKRAWLRNWPTQTFNIVSNHLFAELGGLANGSRPAALSARLPRAIRDVLRYSRTRAQTPAMQRMSAETEALGATRVSTATKGGGGDPRILAGMAGRKLGSILVNPGAAAKAVWDLPLTVFHVAEQAYKLALFELLEPKMGARAAAGQVDKYLFNYADRAPLLEAADRWGLWVFNHFPLQQQRLFVETLVQRPDLLVPYPRLRAMLFEEFPGSREAFEKLPPHYKNLGTLPMGKDEEGVHRFLPLSQGNPLAAGYDTFQEILAAARERRLPEAPLTMRDFLSRTVISPELSAGLNTRLYAGGEENRQIVPPGTAPAIRARTLWGEYAQNRLPGVLRALARIAGAIQGTPVTGGRTAEAESIRSAILTAFLGVRSVKGETFDEAQKRLGPKIGRRLQVAGPVIGRAVEHYRTHPTQVPHGAVPRDLDAKGLERAYAAATKRLESLAMDPRIVSDRGELRDERAIREQVGFILALLLAAQARALAEAAGKR